ncbi:AEC family transporter [Derxia lacustris]|uniref:AEC family transporter n=1 Tax=Derxia lacustris TaxID=764842 RepID=UPI000A172C48|nr:AEC family transporter [Derxia lacustris]
MHQILVATAPIYLLIALGYGAGRAGTFTKADARVLGRFVVGFALPALIFRALTQRPLAEVLEARYLAAYAFGSLLALAIGVGVSMFAARRGLTEGAVNGMGMALSNSGFIGYPILSQLLGSTAGTALALNMVIENAVMLPLVLGLAEAGRSGANGWRAAALATLRQLPRNRLVQAIAAGFAFSFSGLEMPAVLGRSIELLALASAAIAVFVIGASLVGVKLRGEIGAMTGVATGKLLLHPLGVALGFALLPAVAPEMRMAGIAYAAMPMLSIYPAMAQQYGRESFSAATLVVATTLSFFTLSTLLMLLHS